MEQKAFATEHGHIVYWVSHPAADLAADAPWLVLVPGLTADHTLFAPQLEHFASRANLIVWDAPAHGSSRPFPLSFGMDDYARWLHAIMEMEGAHRPILVGQSLGGYVSQALLDLFPSTAAGFVSVDSAPLKKRYMKNWEVWALRHTRLMYLSIPWKLLVSWGCAGTAETPEGQANMRAMMLSYGKREFCELAAHGYRMLADAVDAQRPYELDCPTLLLCGERDKAASTRRYNRAWAQAEGLELVWVPDAGHNSTVDNPAFVNGQIERFVDAVKE